MTNQTRKLKKINSITKILKKPTMIADYKIKGSPSEILFGMLYLFLVYKKKMCIYLPKKFDNMIDSVAVQWRCKNNKQYIKFPVSQSEFMNNIRKCKKQFIIVPLFIFVVDCNNNFGHANCLIFDNKNKTVERFEPYGGSFSKVFSSKELRLSIQFDKVFKKILRSENLKYTYLSSIKVCPTVNVQYKEENNLDKGIKTKARSDDPEGMCSIWIIWYAHLKLKYSNIDSKRLLEKSLELLETEKNSLRSFIRKYSNFIKNEKEKLQKKVKSNKDINEVILKHIYAKYY